MKLLFTLVCTLVMSVLHACDFCGCYMGITPYDNQSSLNILYRYKSYNGYSIVHQQHHLFPGKQSNTGLPGTSPDHNQMKHNTASSGNSYYTIKDYEIYTAAELRARYFIHRRVELNAILPYVMNSSSIGDEKQRVNAAGDMTLLCGYHLINRILTERFQHRVITGAGIKLPTGNWKALNDDGDRIDPLLQSGTGSTDWLGYVNYIFSYKKLGVSFNTMYKISGTNSFHEHIGNASSNYLNIFLKLRSDKDLKIFPSVQGYYEYSNGLFVNRVYQNGTTTNIAMAGAGLDLYYKNISLNASFQLPVFEDAMPTELSSAGRFMVGITYSFNQKNYLLHPKNNSLTL